MPAHSRRETSIMTKSYNRGAILRAAWSQAKWIAALIGRPVRQFIGAAMRKAWSLAEETPAAPAMVPQPVQQQQACAAPSSSTDASQPVSSAVTSEPPAVEPCATYRFGRMDSRCRGWEQVLREGTPLPAPEDITGVGDLPGRYAPDRGEEELFGTDAVLLGEERHHRKSRGWTYRLHVRNPATGEIVEMIPTAEHKAQIKAWILTGHLDLPVEILKGAGEIAGMVRILAAIRAGASIEVLASCG